MIHKHPIMSHLQVMIHGSRPIPMTNGSLTKAALMEEVAHGAGLMKKRVEIIVDTVFGSIVETLHRGERVELRGFGSFRLRAASEPQP